MEQVLKAFGDRVKSVQLERGISQEQLGHLADLDRTYISGIERGVRNVGVLNVIRLAEALDVRPRELMEFGGKSV